MTGWREERFAVVDVETTGLEAGVHEILSVGVVPVSGGRIQAGSAVYRETRPSAAPTRETIVIHGIGPARAATADDPDVAGRTVLAALAGRVLVAHVADIEKGFLAAWLGPLGWQRPRVIVDTDVLARRWLLEERGLRLDAHIGLGAAAGLFGLPEQQRHHALGDALTAAQLFLALAANLGGGTRSARQLARLRPAPRWWGRSG